MSLVVQLRSLNVGHLAPITPGAKSRSGIHKHPVGGAVLCDTLGLVGDAIGNAKHHGGPDQAVYLYSAEDYAWWQGRVGDVCAPGLFGENLTIDAWWPAPRIGDRVRFGEVVLDLTAPRIPCATLAARMGDPRFVAAFIAAGRCGAYARVLHGGALEAGTTGEVTRGDAAHPTIADLFAVWHEHPRDRAQLIRYAASPVSQRARETLLRWATE